MDDDTRDRCAVAAPRHQEDQWAVCNRAVVRKILNNVIGEESEMLGIKPVISVLGRECGRSDDIPSAQAGTWLSL